MKELFLSTIMALFIFYVHAQKFKTAIYVAGENGLKDTVIIGYDQSATNGIDPEFGEVEIPNENQVQIGSVTLPSGSSEIIQYESITDYMGKTHIYPKECVDVIRRQDGFPSYAALFIPYSVYPLTLSWDSTVFIDQCVDNSIFSDWPINTMWDIPCCNDLFINMEHFKASGHYYLPRPSGLKIVNENQDSFAVVTILLESSLFSNSTEVRRNLQLVYPNPVNDYLQIGHIPFDTYALYDLTGKKVQSGRYQRQINMSLHAARDVFFGING